MCLANGFWRFYTQYACGHKAVGVPDDTMFPNHLSSDTEAEIFHAYSVYDTRFI
jgi:hypothetical protein